MFVYAIGKAIGLELIDAKYGAVAERGWKGLQAIIEKDASGRPVFTGAVQGMGVQNDYAGYIKIPRLRNSTHGLMAVQIAASQMETAALGETRAAVGEFADWPAGMSPRDIGTAAGRELRGPAV